jgi:hypothetical protein
LIEWNNPSQIIIRKVCPIHFVLCTFIILTSTQNTYETSGYNCRHTGGFADWKEGGLAKLACCTDRKCTSHATHVMTTQNTFFLVQPEPSHESNSIIMEKKFGMIFCVWKEFLGEEGSITNPHHRDSYSINQKVASSLDDKTVGNVSYLLHSLMFQLDFAVIFLILTILERMDVAATCGSARLAQT